MVPGIPFIIYAPDNQLRVYKLKVKWPIHFIFSYASPITQHNKRRTVQNTGGKHEGRIDKAKELEHKGKSIMYALYLLKQHQPVKKTL